MSTTQNETTRRVSIGDAQNASAGNMPAARQEKTTMRDIMALPKAKQFPRMLEAFRSEISLALPKHLNPDRMARIALTCFRQNPKLAECEPASVFACVIMASQLGLELGVLGQAHPVPFWNSKKRVLECQLIPGYQGLVDLARRSGRIRSLEAHVVYKKDKFKCTFGLNPELVHEPDFMSDDRGEIILVYAVAMLLDGGTHVEVMPRKEVYSIRDRSENYKSAKKFNKSTPWDTDEAQMFIKTVYRRICKFLPKSVELASALALDALAANGRTQDINLNDIIEGESVDLTGWVPAEGAEDDDGAGAAEADVGDVDGVPPAVVSQEATTPRDQQTPVRGEGQALI